MGLTERFIMANRKTGVHYVSNKDLYAVLCEYNEQKELYINEGKDPMTVRIPEAIGEAILKITSRLASRGNFAAYSYRDEMVSDAIENCLAAVDNFDVKKYKNPFAYFTQISWFAFIRRIDKEKRQSYLKIKNYKKTIAEEELANITVGYNPSIQATDEVMDEFVKSYEQTLQRKKKKKEQTKGVDRYYDSDK